MCKSCVRYEEEESFRQAIEKESRISLTDAEWSNLVQDTHAPYDGYNFTELVNAARESSKTRSNSSQSIKTRRHRIAHVERAGLEASQMSEEFREKIFGKKQPPFPNQGLEAAAWIESQVEACATKQFGIEVTLPANLGPIESLIWLKEFLTRELEGYPPFTGNDTARELHRFLGKSGAVRSVNWGMPILEYIGPNSEGEICVRRVQAPDGTLLGKLQSMGEHLAQALAWKPYAAIHHLLTGGVVSPTGVQATTRYRGGRQSFGDSHPMTLNIPDPGSVTNQELVTAFRKELSGIATPWSKQQRQRSRTSGKSERVAALVEETTNMPWGDRLQKWNLRNPEERFRTTSAIKQAYRRARDL